MIVAAGFLVGAKPSGAPRSRSRLILIGAVFGWIAIPIVLGATVLLDSRSSTNRETRSQTPNADVRLDSPTLQTSDLRTLSCSTSNCHGALTANRRETAIRSDEYFVWLNDPHAKAFRTLSGERSRAIFQRLGVADEQSRPLPGQADNFHRQWTNCLACHETNQQLASTAATSKDHSVTRDKDKGHSVTRGEGVSCESCHGPARDWLHLHYQPEWKQSISEARKRELGFVSSRDLPARIKQCADCHVGSRSGGEVDHDLIAAGHPALRFEYVWYQSRLPQHWKSGRRDALATQDSQAIEPQPHLPREDSMRVWLVGQLVTTMAALEQTERRVERRGQHTAGAEFAEFNCFACHHDLRGTSWRQARGIPGLAAIGDKPSRLAVPWGNWNLDLVPLLAEQHASQPSREFSAALDRLREAYQAGYPDRLELIKHSETARQYAHEWLAEVARLSSRDARQLLQQVALRQSKRLTSSWDQTANLLLGFAAPHHAADSIPDPLRVAMDRIRFPQAPKITDSPANFRSTDHEHSLTADEWTDLLRQLANSLVEQ